MAPASQQLLQGGMRRRDWFSDKLEGGKDGEGGGICRSRLKADNEEFKGLFGPNSTVKTKNPTAAQLFSLSLVLF